MARGVEREIAREVLDGPEFVRLARRRQLSQGTVEPAHVARVVLVVVERHRLLVDVRLQRVVGVRQRRQGIRRGLADALVLRVRGQRRQSEPARGRERRRSQK
jgi:hypothetical protein